ncbi:MAG: phospholipid carrier-dependent glycosyltransferase [Pyrinomonadaceae bacterium]
MRDRFFITACLVVVTLGMITVAFPEGAASILVVLGLSSIALLIFRRFSTEREFLTTIFLAALLVRLAFGIFIHIYDLREFFGGDATTYDFNGWKLVEYWTGQIASDDLLAQRAWSTSGPGWGINYLVGGLYYILGRNIFAAQSFCAVFGAATAPMVYFCSVKMFSNRHAAKIAAVAIAFFPSFIIWSSQLMKDGLIIFLLVLAMTMVLQLQEKFNYGALLLLIFSMFGILSLRFYIFYMVAIAVAGSFIVGLSTSVQSIARRTAVLIVMGLALTYLGVIRNATVDFERYGNLERIQSSRDDLAQSAESGFNEEVDISTTDGAISAIPIGFAYLMFAPFPWEITNFRQAITLPEVLLWWAMIPLLVAGLWYAIRQRLRSSIPVLIFSLMLTLAYSIFQGNVGTAYRQRTQIQVFLFIFIAVGWVLFKENKENKKLIRASKQNQLEKRLRAHNSI